MKSGSDAETVISKSSLRMRIVQDKIRNCKVRAKKSDILFGHFHKQVKHAESERLAFTK